MMLNDLARENIAAIVSGYDHTLDYEEEKEELADLPIPFLQKKLKKLNEQIVYLHAENRLFYNYLSWYEKRVLQKDDQEQRNSVRFSLPKIERVPSHQILKHRSKHPLTIEKKREVAEASFKVLLAYSRKYVINITEYVEECADAMETDDETISHLEIELSTLKKFNEHSRQLQKRLTAEELFEFLRERNHYREALDERKRQKTVRLRFHLERLEKSIRKVHQIVDTITEVDFEQLKIDIEKQLKELNIKNKMLIFYKQQQSEANMKFNAKKPELFKEIRLLTSIRNEINTKTQRINHYNSLKQKMEEESAEYEKSNVPLREMTISYRVPSIHNYVELKSKQLHLLRQKQIWERKVQIAEREFHLRRNELTKYPERIIHPWKYLQNPSSILFHQQSKTPAHRTNDTHLSNVKNTLNVPLPKSISSLNV